MPIAAEAAPTDFAWIVGGPSGPKELWFRSSKKAPSYFRYTAFMQRIVILGAGFGGLFAAKKLARVAADVTVVDRHNYHLFQPLLYQVATAGLPPSDIAWPIRSILSRQKN
ncbi:MAG: FAD-dependent oxidoreductase, partial [Gammaproteobacteria bacterium]|nr:FAD-dependent oxidoreductase [Gammaproteobacteria bacterium]